MQVCIKTPSYCTQVNPLKPEIHQNSTRFHREVPGIRKRRNADLTYSMLAAISFKIVSLGTYIAIPSFLPRFESTVEIIFLNAV
jgi:hypothetical protein